MKERNNAHMWYLHLEAARCFRLEVGPTEEELQHFRVQLCLPTDEVPIRPVVIVVHAFDHYFVVVLDYEGDAMYVFGRHVREDLAGVGLQDDADWRAWQGDWLWMNVPTLFRWEGFSIIPGVILSVNWPQVCISSFPLVATDGESLEQTNRMGSIVVP
jgi:hypothetical protein